MLRISIVFGFALLLSFLSTARAADEVPGPPQVKPVLLMNGVIHPVSGPAIKNGFLLFENGVIQTVSKKRPKTDAEVINLNGKHVYPGMIETMSQIGLVEIPAVRSSRDGRETGTLNPNVMAVNSFNPDSAVIPVTRANGVLLAVSSPSGGLVSGRSSLMMMDGWTNFEMALKPEVAMVVNWPSPARSGKNTGLEQLTEFIEEARAYQVARHAEPNQQAFDIRLEAMLPVLAGKIPMMAKADEVQEIQSAIAFCVEQDLKLIIFGGHDAMECVDLLKQHSVPVIVDSTHRRPARRHEAYDVAYTLPAQLKIAGVQFCISGSGRSETWNSRNLPYHASFAAAHGLDKAEALKSVTLYPAQILGVDSMVGSLKPGKHATLIVTTGDPLETDTSVTSAWIKGRRVQLTSRHTRLYEKYKQKYKQLELQP